jgi:asparagine synthase (glutamine-hydrolysing)
VQLGSTREQSYCSNPDDLLDIAERTAEHLGVNLTKALMSESSLADDFEDAVYHIEHHTHDLNFVGKYALSRLPRKLGYKCVLTGEGSDEHFAGYPLYGPDFLRGEIAAKNGGGWADADIEESPLVQHAEDSIRDSYDAIGGDGRYFSYPRQVPLSTPAAMAGFNPPPALFTPQAAGGPLPDPVAVIARRLTGTPFRKWHPLHAALYTWTRGHLANQFLSCLGDRVEMAHSVEARTPFLDHKLTEYVNHLPPRVKLWHPAALAASYIRKGANPGEPSEYTEKWALREAAKPFITAEIYERRKHAYTAPSTWPSGGPVHALLARLVTRPNVDRLGFLQWEEVERLLDVAFDDQETSTREVVRAWRLVVMTACWVVLSQRFDVRPANGRTSNGQVSN